MVDFLDNLKNGGWKNIFPEKLKTRRWILFITITAVIIAAFFGISLTYAAVYKDKIYHGVYLNGYSLGGLSGGEVKDFLQNLEKRMREEGINYSFFREGQEQNIKIDITSISSENSFDLASWDKEALVKQAVYVGKDGGFWNRLWQPYNLLFNQRSLTSPVILLKDELKTILKEKLKGFEGDPRDAGLVNVSADPVMFEVEPEKSGEVFDYDEILSQTEKSLAVFSWQKISLKQKTIVPTVLSRELGDWVKPNILAVYNFGDLHFNFYDQRYEENYDWHVKKDVILSWLEPQKDSGGNLFLNIDEEKFAEYVKLNISSAIDQPAQNPKFSMTDGKVEELRGGSEGRETDLSATYKLVTDEYLKVNKNDPTATSTIKISVVTTSPDQELSELNNLGVTDVIGVGISHFKNSHSNRIKNIANAVRILNGTVIAPGEEFSTNLSAGPFSLENGYLAEDVIKGDQIVKEIAGGMCQIGTTLFRMAMNSGMPVTERRNHSLVVSYYADPVNGNPGTDATVYEPILDFKFLNDTGSYLLIQTEMDTEKEELRFTLWGKPDGRSGSYTHPIVSRWIPAGAAKTIESTTMKPGEKKCQNAFPGAVASFTYTRITPEGEKIERVFDSTYRALPAICWVGVEEKTETPTEGDVTECTGDNCAENPLPENTDDSIIEDVTVSTST